MQKIPEGGSPGGHNPPGHAITPWRALGVVVPTWPPSLISSSHFVTYLQKKFTLALSPVFLLILLPFSISLLEAPFSKLFRKWSIEQRDRNWQQNEQEHGRESKSDFFLEVGDNVG